MKVSRRVQVAAVFAALGLVVVAVGPRTGVWPARLGGPADGGATDDEADIDAAEAAQIGQATDDPAEVPPDVELGSPDADLLQRAEDARNAEPPEAPKLAGGGDPEPVADPDTLNVLFDEGTSSDEIAAALDAAGVDGEPIDGIAAAVVRLDGRSPDEVEAAFEDDPLVTGTEPNLIREATATPNDPQMANQLAALQTIRVPTAWDVADGSANVTVAVLDTGIDLDHPDLKPNIVAGRDVVHGDNSPGDDNGHGTMTAGLIGARTNNGIGIAGVAWNAKIMAVKVLDSTGGGSDAWIATGIVWATDHGAKVINLSLGGPGTSSVLDQAVLYARNRNVVVVASSGNDASTVIHYPAGAPGVIAVTATDAQGRFAWFSDHGPWVSLAAPGIDVRTTRLASGATAAVDDGTGTSFAAPLVAGVAALVRERHPGWSASRVASQLTRTARDAGPAGIDDAYGYGIVDATAALGVGPKAPVAPPPDLSGDAGNFFTAARPVSAPGTFSETLSYEFDEDWFSFDSPGTGTATIAVNGPPFLPDPETRAQELDPMFELYGPTGVRVGDVIDAPEFSPTESAVLPVSAGRYTLRVRNYLGSAAPGPYTLVVGLSTTAAATSWTAAATVDDLAGEPAVGDFDADGDADVAAGNDDAIAVAWNEGDELSAPESYPAAGASSLVAADLDGASARPTTELIGTTDVWRWTGDGFTATPLGFDRGTPAAAGDVTGDGLADIVDIADGAVRVHAQKAGSTWADPTDVAIAPLTAATALAVGDVSGDGHADLVISGTDAGGTTRVVRLLQAGGTLGAATVLPGAEGAGPASAAAIGDVDGDDRGDVVVLHEGKVGAYTQDAAGHLGDEQVLPAPDATAGTTAPALADLDGDGHGDLVAAAAGSANAVVVLEQQFTAAAVTASSRALMFASTSPAPHATGVATSVHPSVTLAATPDAATVNTTNVSLVDGRTGGKVAGTVATSGATVTFTPNAPLIGGVPYRIVVKGVTLAGRRNTANGEFPFVTAEEPAPAFTVNEDYYIPFTLDVDGNGYDDVFWYAPGAARDVLWRMRPSGRTSVAATVNGTYTPLAGDFDGNGYDDIFWYAPGAGTDTIWYSGPSGFTTRTMPVSGTYRPVVGDFDRNGYDDIFWHGPGTAPDTLWRFGPFGKTDSSHPVSGTSYEPFAGDLNRDAYDDIYWHQPGSTTVSLWRGGSRPFAIRLTTSGIGGDRDARPLDSNGDGYDDIYWFQADDGELWRSGSGGFTPQDGPALPGTARPVTGDFTGDLRDDLLGYVPGTTADQLYRGSASGLG